MPSYLLVYDWANGLCSQGSFWSIIFENDSHLIRHGKPSIKKQGLTSYVDMLLSDHTHQGFCEMLCHVAYGNVTMLAQIALNWYLICRVPFLQVVKEVNSWQVRDVYEGPQKNSYLPKFMSTAHEIWQRRFLEFGFLALK